MVTFGSIPGAIYPFLSRCMCRSYMHPLWRQTVGRPSTSSSSSRQSQLDHGVAGLRAWAFGNEFLVPCWRPHRPLPWPISNTMRWSLCVELVVHMAGFSLGVWWSCLQCTLKSQVINFSLSQSLSPDWTKTWRKYVDFALAHNCSFKHKFTIKFEAERGSRCGFAYWLCELVPVYADCSFYLLLVCE